MMTPLQSCGSLVSFAFARSLRARAEADSSAFDRPAPLFKRIGRQPGTRIFKQAESTRDIALLKTE